MRHGLLKYNNIQLIEEIDPEKSDILASFAMDDTLCISAGETGEAAIRFWVHGPTAVLGIPDSRLPDIDEATKFLNEQNHEVIIRNSGGLAVILDEGILNVSLIFPHGKSIDIHEDYQTMVDFIQWVFEEEPIEIEAYEIHGSYCPGTYDLSVDGKKFAGISQRRVKNGTAVQVYLGVEGNGAKRAELIRDFYRIGRSNQETKFEYPDVKPNVMVTLEEILGKKITVSDLVQHIKQKLTDSHIDLSKKTLTNDERQQFEKRLKMMKKRNERIDSFN